MSEAQQAFDKARHELETIPRITPGIIPSRALVQPWVDALHGELLLKNGSQEEGRKILKDVQRALRSIPGPDTWIQTLFRLESIARTAREANDWELAEYTATQMLDHDAAYGGSHLALALVLEKKGDAAGAAKEFEIAKRYWQQADPEIVKLTKN
jgi:hypothetical protein